MTGHQRIIAMRRAGRKPTAVWVSDFPGPLAELQGDAMVVRVAGESPELLDLRFLVGTLVIVEGGQAERVRRIAKACAAHARRVVASVIEPIDGRQEVTAITDTQEEMTWPKP